MSKFLLLGLSLDQVIAGVLLEITTATTLAAVAVSYVRRLF
jgi:hypothetical protein